MSIRDRMSGNEAIATAMRQINPDVFAMFPITPSTEIPQYFAQYVADGKVDTEFICVESEHSSMSACIGAEAAGARAVTATSSAGLSFMNEMLFVAASARLPIVLAVANRALTGPININHDYSEIPVSSRSTLRTTRKLTIIICRHTALLRPQMCVFRS